VARVLIVGCGCRGRELAAALVADGVAVRGTTRDEASLETIEATGAQAALADPDRLSTILPQLEDVAIVC
jgi:3-hydroxyisobutyrate dehydrogenase-like beta-hydroxyacid dehydrogenase